MAQLTPWHTGVCTIASVALYGFFSHFGFVPKIHDFAPLALLEAFPWYVALCTLVTIAVQMGIVVAHIYLKFRSSVRERLAFLPGRQPSFPLGSMGTWCDLLKANKEILEDSKSGSLPVAQWTFTGESVAVVRNEHVRKVFKSSYSREMSPWILNWAGMHHIKAFMGAHMVGVAENKEWKTIRKAIGSSLKPSYLNKLYPDMIAAAEKIGDFMQIKGVLDVSGALHALTLDVVCIATFQEKLGAIDAYVDGKPKEAVEAFKYASSEMARRIGSQNPLDWVYSSTWGEAKLVEAQTVIRNQVNEVIDRRLARGDGQTDDDTLSQLLLLKKLAMFGESSSVVADNVLGILWAGSDTTATALSFAMHYLAENPSIQTRLREEIMEAKEQNNGTLNSTTVCQLPFLYAILNETLRLHPPALWTNRGMTEDIVLFDENNEQSVTLKKGSIVVVPIYAICRSPANWTNPSVSSMFRSPVHRKLTSQRSL